MLPRAGHSTGLGLQRSAFCSASDTDLQSDAGQDIIPNKSLPQYL